MLQSLASTSPLTSQTLERAQEPREILDLLKQFGFSDEDIAEGTATNPRTVRRWKVADDHPGTAAGRRLGELRNVVLLLRESEGLTDTGVVYWLRHANRLLEDHSPLRILGAGGFRSVRDAGLCFVDLERPFSEKVPAEVLQAAKEAERSKVSPARAAHRSRSRPTPVN